VSQVEK